MLQPSQSGRYRRFLHQPYRQEELQIWRLAAEILKTPDHFGKEVKNG
jgi:hypothetical protein